MPVSARSAESVAAKGAVIPPWAHKLPGCLFAVLKFLYFDLLLPDDSFEVSMRKLLMAVGPYAFVFGPVAVGGLFTLSGTYTWNAASFVAGTAQAAFGLLWFTLLIAAKLNPRLGGTDLFVDLWIGVAAFLACVASFAVPAVAWDVCVALISFVAIIFRSRVRVPVALLTSVVAMLSVYNRGVFNSGGSTSGPPLVAFPNAATPNHLWVQLVADEAIYLLHLPVWFCLEVFLRESDRRHAASIASVELAKRLAAALSRYDTKSAREALDSMGTDGEVAADAELVEGFRSIVANLDEYRPHLPNWLVTKHSASAGEDDEDEEELDGERPNRSASRTPGDGTRSRSAKRSVVSHSSRTSRTSNATTASVRFAAGDNARVNATGDHRALRSARIALAELDVAMATNDVLLTAAETTATLHAFVDKVHSVARDTRAAVHSFVGDAVSVSWGAATTCLQPEAKAARFAARLAKWSSTNEMALRVTGAVELATANVLLAGHGEQRALLVSPPAATLRVLRRAREEARRRRAVLGTAALAQTAQYAATFHLAAVLPRLAQTDIDDRGDVSSSVKTEGSAALLLYAVAGEVSDGGDEWMYVLDKQQNHHQQQQPLHTPAAISEMTGELLRHLTTACENGDFEGARDLLNEKSSCGSDLHARLKRDLERYVSSVRT